MFSPFRALSGAPLFSLLNRDALRLVAFAADEDGLDVGAVNDAMRARGWHADHLGTWDGGQSSDATKEFAGSWRAVFGHFVAGYVDAPLYRIDHAGTGDGG